MLSNLGNFYRAGYMTAEKDIALPVSALTGFFSFLTEQDLITLRRELANSAALAVQAESAH